MLKSEIVKPKTVTPSFRVLGVRVHAVQIDDTIEQIEQWIEERKTGHFVAFTGMHGVTEARHDIQFRNILNSADLVVPDGMPLVWLGRWHKYSLERRVYGPDLMHAFCSKTGPRYRHFFFGGTTGVAEELARTLCGKYGIVLAGTYTPPFRPLTKEEEMEVAARIAETAPDLLWVGLSTPKQERWMYGHRHQLEVSVMLGVGAAFDLNSGRVRQAPVWMRENGLEWLFRLLVEPRRLWKRYLVTIPSSIWSISLELLRLRKFQ